MTNLVPKWLIGLGTKSISIFWGGGGGCKTPQIAILDSHKPKTCNNWVPISKKLYNSATVICYIYKLLFTGCKLKNQLFIHPTHFISSLILLLLLLLLWHVSGGPSPLLTSFGQNAIPVRHFFPKKVLAGTPK